MIAVVQRVTSARVEVAGQVVGQIGHGLAVLLSVHRDDTPEDVAWMAGKLTSLRIFRKGEKHFDIDVKEAAGGILLVSNFTVSAATKRGRRPSFDAAASGEKGQQLFDDVVAAVKAAGLPVSTGQFGADMLVTLSNDGPATFIVDSRAED
jgi:D-aminoacyl-tRNA deacylase